jgi:hypothetical protein
MIWCGHVSTQARDLFLAAGPPQADGQADKTGAQNQQQQQQQMQALRLSQVQQEEGEEAAQENQAKAWAPTSYTGEDEGAERGWSHENWVEQALQQVVHGKAKKGKGRKSASVHPTQEVRLH